jgi:MFS family permease
VKRFSPAVIVLAAGFMLMLFHGGSRFVMGLTLGPMSDDLGWSRATLSAAVLVFLVVSSLALPFAGRLVDRYDTRAVLAISLVLACLGIGLMGVIDAPWQAIVLYGILYGAASACTSTPTVAVMVSRWFPHRLGIANSVALSGMGIGQLVIILALTSQLDTVGWRGSFIALGIAGAVLILPMTFFAISPGKNDTPAVAARADAPASPLTDPGLRDVLRARPFWLLVAMYGICGFQDHFVATHIVAFARDQGLSYVLAGNVFAFMGLFGLIGVLGSGYLSDRFGPIVPTVLCFVLRVVIFTLAAVSDATFAIVGFALLYGMTFWITAPLTAVYTREHFGTTNLGTINGLITMVHNGFGGLGAYLGGVVFDMYGSYGPILQLMIGLALVALLLALLIRANDAPKP